MIDNDKLQEAKRLFKNKEYEKSLEIYSDLWESSNKDNHNLLKEYGDALRKCDKSIDFIKIFIGLDKTSYLRNNPFVHSALCWCTYEEYIKKYDSKNIDEFDNFLKKAQFIVEHCEQKSSEKEHYTPYVLTIKKVVKSYNDKSSTRNSKKSQEEIVKWLNLLNPSLLSEQCLTSNINGEDYEQASSKEFYYQNLVKAYEKIGKYSECILLGEKSLQEIKKFHFRNKTWIKARILYSKCMISNDIETDIEEYKKMAEKERYWFMWYKLSNICYSFGKMKESLFFNCKAITQEYGYEKMVNLFYNLGLCWKAEGNEDNAKIYWEASAYYRNLKGWNISEELQYYILAYELDINKKPDKRQLQHLANDYINKNDKTYEYGVIHNILSHGGAGFIKPDLGNQNIYFNMRSVIGDSKNIKENRKVKYKKVLKDNGDFIAISVEGV